MNEPMNGFTNPPHGCGKHGKLPAKVPPQARVVGIHLRLARWLAPALVAGFLLFPVLIPVLFSAGMFASSARAEPNFFEQRLIEAKALEAFKRMIVLWQEEVYFELYAEGMSASKARISQEVFAQRMVELSWVPFGDLNPKYLKASYRFRTMVYISVRMPYRHKFNPENRFSKQQTLALLFEEGRWRIDLVELIRSPYSGV